MDTAHALSLEERFNGMKNLDESSIYQTMFRDSRDVIDAFNFFETLKAQKPEGSDERKSIDLTQADLYAIMEAKVQLTKEYMGLQSSPIPSAPSTIEPEKVNKKEPKVIQLNPDQKEVEEKSLDIETKPLPFKEISNECKRLLSEGDLDATIIYAQEYLGTGNYIPKKSTAKATPWGEKQINDWLKDLKRALDKKKESQEYVENKTNINKKDNSDIKEVAEKEHKKEEKANKLELTRSLKDYMTAVHKGHIQRPNGNPLNENEKQAIKTLESFAPTYMSEGIHGTDFHNVERDKINAYGLPKDTVKEEDEALNTAITRYMEMTKRGEEDKQAAEKALELFFQYRGYSKNQINEWVELCKKLGSDKLTHTKVLGAPELFYPKGLKENPMTKRQFEEAILEEKPFEDTRKELVETLAGTKFLGTPLYTDAYANEYISENLSRIKQEKIENERNSYPMENILAYLDVAVKNDVNADQVFKEQKDSIIKPNGELRYLADGDNKVEFKNEKELKDWIVDKMDELSKSTPKKGNDSRPEVLLSSLYDSAKNSDSLTQLLNSETVKRYMQEGVVVNGSEEEDPDSPGNEINMFNNSKQSRKEFKKFLNKIWNEVGTKKKEDKQKETDITSFKQLYPEGKKLIESGKTVDEVVAWAKKNILNKKLEEHQDDTQIWTDEDHLENIVRSMFEKKKEKEEPTIDKETGEKLIDQHIEDQSISMVKTIRSVKGILHEMGETQASLNSSLDLIKKRGTELKSQKVIDYVEKKRKQKEEKENAEKTHVQEKFSDKFPEDWKQFKNISTTEALYNNCKLIKEVNDWKDALAYVIEVTAINEVEGIEKGNIEQATEWFNKNIIESKPNTEQEKKEKKEEKKTEIPSNVKSLMNCKSKKAFKISLDEIMSTIDDTPELRKNIILAIKEGTGSHTRKVAKSPENEIQSMINSSKERIKKYK